MGGFFKARRGSESQLRGKYVADFLSAADLQQISPGFSVHILGDLQSDFPSDKIILSTWKSYLIPASNLHLIYGFANKIPNFIPNTPFRSFLFLIIDHQIQNKLGSFRLDCISGLYFLSIPFHILFRQNRILGCFSPSFFIIFSQSESAKGFESHIVRQLSISQNKAFSRILQEFTTLS